MELFPCEHCITCSFGTESKIRLSDMYRYCTIKGYEKGIEGHCNKYKEGAANGLLQNF